ncbi:hypothetical protein XELAEV_18036058mg [Xenopus laevis]|uniref:Uncharacterized protein n=1 Tax=Xenopus laevis TaxID=8355 RepID=A0A974CGQ3_XENLA|nr:hypothetical protein XELAEV_18036058mg [Xenopus laevis]
MFYWREPTERRARWLALDRSENEYLILPMKEIMNYVYNAILFTSLINGNNPILVLFFHFYFVISAKYFLQRT